MRRLGLASVVLGVVPLLLAACGGGGGDSGGQNTANVDLTVSWAARTRDIAAPSSALSLVVTLKGAARTGGDFTFTIDRDPNPAAYKKTYSSPQLAKLGTWDLSMRFYSQPNGGGSVVGTIDAQINLDAKGHGIGDFSTTGTIASVSVVPGQTLAIGVPTDIAFTAKDASGAVLALTPGAAVFAVTGGAGILQIDAQGHAIGQAVGTATVNVTVDGIKSADETVAVGASVQITPASTSMLVNGQIGFSAKVTGSPGDNAVIWSVQEGAAGGVVDATGTYTAPGTPGTYHVVAASHYDTSRTSVATVAVSQPAGDITHGIYVLDSSRIVRFDDMTGANWNAYAGSPTDPDLSLAGATSIFVASDGRIYVADSSHNRIVRFDDMTGKNRVTFGTVGSGQGQLSYPSSVCVGPDSKLYIADQGNDRIVRVDDMSGAGWVTYGAPGNTEPGTFALLWTVYVSSSGIYAVDTHNLAGIIRIDDMSGANWSRLSVGGPPGLYVSPDGHIYFALGGQVKSAPSMSGPVQSYSPHDPTNAAAASFRGVALDSFERIYAADNAGHRLFRMDDMTGTNLRVFAGVIPGLGQISPVSVSVH